MVLLTDPQTFNDSCREEDPRCALGNLAEARDLVMRPRRGTSNAASLTAWHASSLEIALLYL